ncbi:NACHT domain-containing protein [Mesorhizobium qingshengii]|uniref:NACHT domain-containing protein n=1 Tax=Mesorhizobium qingshengii TaxID=1165689 RepID=A0A1G5YXL4_9HYPH|nr:hypothetical protein [Mesorhizobium qingshengii]SDA86993.1 hypothetical protein SAMN02927914_03822 [Mesorhizobium qingshengii]
MDLPIDQQPFSGFLADFGNLVSTHSEQDEDIELSEDDEIEFGSFIVHSHPNILSTLMHRSFDKFDPQSWYQEECDRSDEKRFRRRSVLPNRIVLLGGPGQGKSTIGQFLAQLCRARLLRETRSAQTPEINSAIAAILKRAAVESIPVDGPLRYPFHVELPRYADALSEAHRVDSNLSIAAYLAKQVEKASDVGVTSAAFRRWMKEIPTVVILDGLDEVPHSGNRTQVILAIEEFLDTLHEENADSLILATSRPQGYQDELSPKLWEHWNLELLDTSDALKLASYAAPILVSEESRRDEIMTILSEAAQEEATAPLMSSPLQVMLLFQLVSTHNNIPKDRWTLFYRHYETLRDREIAKGGRNGQTIGRFRSQIDRIHYDAGYLLHLRAEGTGGANAFFTIAEFSTLVMDHLRRDGFDDDLPRLTHEIVDLATNRLVFLRCQVEGQVAFDVRSLQEFMAAARLTTSPEGRIKDRLYEIAGRAHWLHVFKIACSKIYASNAHEALREPIIALLDSLDTGDRSPNDRIVKVGARLALQLLTDGTASSLPIYRRKLTVRAIKLLSVPDRDVIRSLARALDLSNREILEPFFVEAISGGDIISRHSALRLLGLVSRDDQDHNFDWPSELLAKSWPTTPSEVLEIFDELSFIPHSRNIIDRIKTSLWQTSPARCLAWIRDMASDSPDEREIPPDLLICEPASRQKYSNFYDKYGSRTNISFSYVGMRSSVFVEQVPDSALPIWRLARSVSSFCEDPTTASAAAFLDEMCRLDLLEEAKSLQLPWVLRALLVNVGDVEALRKRSDELRAGLHGDTAAWEAAETRWESSGVTQLELVPTNGEGGIPSNFITQGAPPPTGRRIERGYANALPELLDLVERLPTSIWALNTLLFYISRTDLPLDDERANAILIGSSKNKAPSGQTSSWLVAAIVAAWPTAKNHELLADRLRELLPIKQSLFSRSSSHLETLLNIFSSNPDLRDLLPLIANLYRALYRPSEEGKLSRLEFQEVPGDRSEISASIMMLRILEGDIDSNLSTIVQTLLASESVPVPFLLRALARDSERRTRTELALAIAREVLTRRKVQASRIAYDTLSNAVDAQPVLLAQAAVADRLELPQALAPPSSAVSQ